MTLQALQTRLGHAFANTALLEQALSHPSLGTAAVHGNYERLELLGDSVLALVISEFLLDTYPEEAEGDIAKRRAALVCGPTLAQIARELDVGAALLLGESEAQSGGRDNDATLENALEAVIGALYLDAGLEVTRGVILPLFAPLADAMAAPPKDPKTALQEWAQAAGKKLPVYTVTETTGPSHAPEFTVEAAVEGYAPAQASGASKKAAERDAAAALLEVITGDGDA